MPYTKISDLLTESKKQNSGTLRKKRGHFHDLEFAYIKIKLCTTKDSIKKAKKASHTLEMHISDNGLVFRTYRMSTYQTERQNNPIEKQKRSDQATDRRENPSGQ